MQWTITLLTKFNYSKDLLRTLTIYSILVESRSISANFRNDGGRKLQLYILTFIFTHDTTLPIPDDPTNQCNPAAERIPSPTWPMTVSLALPMRIGITTTYQVHVKSK